MEYSEITHAQNLGVPCPHCDCTSGHFGHCPLINREVAEASSATLSTTDHQYLYALGVRW